MIILKPIIKLENVCKYYYSNNTVTMGLNKINLEFSKGEFVAIIGLSGAGKSTLIRTINRVHDISEGTLTVDTNVEFDNETIKEETVKKNPYTADNHYLVLIVFIYAVIIISLTMKLKIKRFE